MGAIPGQGLLRQGSDQGGCSSARANCGVHCIEQRGVIAVTGGVDDDAPLIDRVEQVSLVIKNNRRSPCESIPDLDTDPP